jgi:anti-sigma factor RsiW
MTRERFEDLAEAYGGDVARWPPGEREAAAALMAADPALAREVLRRAEDLDSLLDAWSPLAVRRELHEAVIAAAPRDRRRAGLREWIWRVGLSAGLAGACAAGLAVGVGLSNATHPDEAVSAAMSGYDELSEVVNGEDA